MVQSEPMCALWSSGGRTPKPITDKPRKFKDLTYLPFALEEANIRKIRLGSEMICYASHFDHERHVYLLGA